MIPKRSLSQLSALASAAVLATSAQASAALISHYSFDSDYSLTGGSYSGSLSKVETSGATVSITNTAGEHVFGGGAADFASTISNEAYLSLSQSISFGSSNPWSISFWSRRDPNADDRQGMVIGDTSNSTDFIWRSNNPSQVEGLRFRNSGNTTYDFDGFPDSNSFEHWVVVSDGSGTITTYRNSVAQTPKTSASGTFNINGIGSAYNSAVQTMNGQIDELYIFDEAIDATTVGNLFNSNTIPEPGSLTLVGLGGLRVVLRRNRRS